MKLKHLVSNVDLPDWQQMMDIIQKDIATPKLIIDQITQEINKMKIWETDKAFVDQVNNLERIVRDLRSLGRLSEISNTAMINKLESKLPDKIDHNWTQKIFIEELSERTT